MDISLADERAFQINPQVTLEVARVRVDDKRTGLVAGTVGALLSRPKPDEIRMVSMENRLEPFWAVTIKTHTVFDRNRIFTFSAAGPEVKSVTLLEHEVSTQAQLKGAPTVTLQGVEHCLEETEITRHFDGVSGAKGDYARYMSAPSLEILSLENFAPENILVVPPQARASAVVRQVMGEIVQAVQAQTILEERVDVTAIDLFFRPVYAFEYEWAAKNKKVVVEYDAITGDARAGGKWLGEQLKGMVTRDLVFDVTADAVGLIVPGGSIAVKLVKAIADRK
jgi:hypothetical protein